MVDTDPDVIEDLLDGVPMDAAPDEDAESEVGDVDVENGPGPETADRDQEGEEEVAEDEDLDAYFQEGVCASARVAMTLSRLAYMLHLACDA